MLIFEWGLNPPDPVRNILKILPGTLNEKKAHTLFSELHRDYALRLLRGKPLQFFSPEDAVILSGFSSRAILGTTNMTRETSAPPLGGKSLLYSDESVIIEYVPGGKEGKLSITWRDKTSASMRSAQKNAVLYGSALWEVAASPDARLEYAPLFAYCGNCAATAGIPERLIMNTRAEALKTDLADNFSLAPDIQKPQDCAPAVPVMEDTLYFQPTLEEISYPPCDMRIDKLMLESESLGDLKAAAYLIFAMGWRKDLTVVFVPRAVTAQARSAYLFDFFQRVNRRRVKGREAFAEAKTRAEKSFPDDVALRSVLFYESIQ
jgi:hypothetical protein